MRSRGGATVAAGPSARPTEAGLSYQGMPGAAMGIVVAPPLQVDARYSGSAAMFSSVSAVALWRCSQETPSPMTPIPGEAAAGFP